MTAAAVAGLPRVAATVRAGDILRLADGTVRTVATTPTPATTPIGTLTLLIKFAEGGALRVSAGAELDIERPA
ncbi:hypothetical protein [Streptomyces sp. NPDC096339]|uniref:hypothetical protein n=1 Tax=Streptomyces sp. NPDC096339 TaxID=3366086 RepID=UPI0038110215